MIRLCTFSTAPKFKYGYEKPKNYSYALKLDKCNGSTKWTDATKLELELMDSYNIFEDKSLKAASTEGYKTI